MSADRGSPAAADHTQAAVGRDSSVVLRQFTLADYDAVIAVWQQCSEGVHIGRSDTREEIAKKIARDPDLFIVAEDAEAREIVGTVIGGFDGRRGLIYHLAVKPSHRGQGIGRALMDEVERRLASKGCLRAYLFVVPENLKVLEFYEKLGWEAMPVTPMAKNLF